MEKLSLRPDADGYNATEGVEVIASQLDGGSARYRRDKIGASKSVSVKWTMNREQYAYWRAFYVTGTQRGALPFLCDLVSEDGNGPTEQTCYFVPGSVSLPTQQGLTYVQQAVLEVRPLPHDPGVDSALILLGPDAARLLFGLEHLVNVTMPESIGA